MMTENELSYEIIGSAIEVHRTLGPGLLESAYEEWYRKNRFRIGGIILSFFLCESSRLCVFA